MYVVGTHYKYMYDVCTHVLVWYMYVCMLYVHTFACVIQLCCAMHIASLARH